ncbi:ParA family protein [Tropicibacter oceani]|uniref:ParA family protein n=1 Tax=Tropicibacter oceani TaxID=3058420 RepID=A0ABY8QM13_9RHOB|nr:ParA family protein [Tropicibacter oceani]WGW05674.1 ParA family protein [Tropicibacter oceani]
MKILTVFNNKGGVGKTTLTYHMAHALAEKGVRVLMIDLDPQCNLTVYALEEEVIEKIWLPEDDFIEDFKAARGEMSEKKFNKFSSQQRSVHFALKPIEDGTEELRELPPPLNITDNLDLVPGRLTLHTFESKVAERFSSVYSGDPLSIRTATAVRAMAESYADDYNYDIVVLDTSPSLGALNRNVLSQADAFIIPGNPDLFSVYGIRNIGAALGQWKKQYDSIFTLLSDAKRHKFSKQFVKFLGFTLYNARRLQGSKSTNEMGIATAHYNYAKKLPDVVFSAIPSDLMAGVDKARLKVSIGDEAVIYGHNTLPSMAQKYHLPMWLLPSSNDLEPDDARTIRGNKRIYEATQGAYAKFAADVIDRLKAV